MNASNDTQTHTCTQRDNPRCSTMKKSSAPHKLVTSFPSPPLPPPLSFTLTLVKPALSGPFRCSSLFFVSNNFKPRSCAPTQTCPREPDPKPNIPVRACGCIRTCEVVFGCVCLFGCTHDHLLHLHCTVQIYDRLKVAPSVATREPYTREPKPVEANFRSSGNPYRGGKVMILSRVVVVQGCSGVGVQW